MRQIQKIRQYQRLAVHYGLSARLTTIAEVAEVALCSERHARTLLRQLAESGWLSWKAQAGRGHRATLHCLVTTSELSAPLMHACLEKGDYQSALQLADGDPASLHHIITPFLGGKWLKHQPTLRIPWYRPLTSLHPALHRRRAEQHIICAVHAGLTRYEPGQAQPVADLAHHWACSDDGLRWHFYLRSGAHWHNGQPLSDDDILSAVQQLLSDPARNSGLLHIDAVTLVAPLVSGGIFACPGCPAGPPPGASGLPPAAPPTAGDWRRAVRHCPAPLTFSAPRAPALVLCCPSAAARD
ncbi:SgrR family transcriptional regulator [Leclercia sp. S52]|uniref:SgrR family transcriptional regulator n=1 Tax=Leclercia sp. S52 TaxID=3138178 RepID=UPI00321AA277